VPRAKDERKNCPKVHRNLLEGKRFQISRLDRQGGGAERSANCGHRSQLGRLYNYRGILQKRARYREDWAKGRHVIRSQEF